MCKIITFCYFLQLTLLTENITVITQLNEKNNFLV